MRSLFSLALGLTVSSVAASQTPPDTTVKTPAPDDGGAKTFRWYTGIAAGQMRFSDGAEERAIGVALAVNVRGWLDLAVNPTYAWARGAPVVTSLIKLPGRQVQGLADLPVSVGISRQLPGSWGPLLSLSVGATLPTGDTTRVGSGVSTVGANLNFGFAPTSVLWLGFGAGRSLSNGYGVGLANSAPTSVAGSVGLQLGRVGVSATWSGDVGPVEVGYESARSIGGGLSIPIVGNLSLTMDGSSGLTDGSPDWAFSAGFGTTTAGLSSVTVAPFQRLKTAFGTGRKFLRTKPRTRATTETTTPR